MPSYLLNNHVIAPMAETVGDVSNYLLGNRCVKLTLKLKLTSSSAIAERPRCRVG